MLPNTQWRSPASLLLDIDNPNALPNVIFDKDTDQSISHSEAENNSWFFLTSVYKFYLDDKELVKPTGVIVAILERRSFRKYCGSVDLTSIVEKSGDVEGQESTQTQGFSHK